MSELPEPLTPPDCDLRGQSWMPLFGDRLFNSDFEARASDAEFRAAMTLWWKSWVQVPAASLPDDDIILCKLAGLGRDMKAWKALREGNVLHGFIKCSDGRLYHALLADEAVLSYERRLKSAQKRDADKLRLEQWRANKATKRENNTIGNADETRFKTQDETQGETRTELLQNANDTSKTRPDQTRPDKEKETAANAAAKKIGERASSVRGTRLHEDWLPSPADRDYATERGLDWQRVFEDFRGYWLAKAGKDAVKTDWSLTWQGWCRRQAERAPPPPNLLSPPPRLVQNTQAISAFGPIEAWCKPPINATLGERGGDIGHAIVGGCYIDWCARKLLDVTGIRDAPRSDWHVLADWLREGMEWDDHIEPVLIRMASRPDYEPPGTLKYFDRAVRENRRAA